LKADPSEFLFTTPPIVYLKWRKFRWKLYKCIRGTKYFIFNFTSLPWNLGNTFLYAKKKRFLEGKNPQ
jgi:hypothetical protein